MSYDINWKVKAAEAENLWVSIPYPDNANITYNVGDLIRTCTGLTWKNCEDNGYVKDVIPYIEKGLKELEQHPEKYKHLEAPNGWGTIDGTIRFFNKLIDGWHSIQNDYFWQDFANIVHFWIE